MNLTKSYAEIYPYVEEGSFLDESKAPQMYKQDLALAKAEAFA